ncbi:MAG: radical SAM protein [Rhodospirillaceae bacterium]
MPNRHPAPALDPAHPALHPAKFRNPDVTARGERRAAVALTSLESLWINTGSLCNIECDGCYIESSPKNDRLAYIRRDDVAAYLDEIAAGALPVAEIGFTGGEPFMNPDLTVMAGDCLARGYRVLILTNAMKPMWHKRDALIDLKARHGDALAIRVSVDHYTSRGHEAIRGAKTWAPMIQGLTWLSENGFNLSVAARMAWNETEDEARAGYARLFASEGIALDALWPGDLVLFPDMDVGRDVPEITDACWSILNVDPADMMCATSRMLVKRKGADKLVVLPCTLLPYDTAFEMGPTLTGAAGPVKLNHPHCATFCVLGGASCSGAQDNRS